MVNTCEIDEAVKAAVKKFRFRKDKDKAAIVMKIDMSKLVIVLDDSFEDDELEGISSLESLAADLSETSHRYILYSHVYNHSDGRVSYPMIFFYFCPQGANPEHNMIYAGAKTHLVRELKVEGKVYDVNTQEDLCDDWINDKLTLFT